MRRIPVDFRRGDNAMAGMAVGVHTLRVRLGEVHAGAGPIAALSSRIWAA